jgi:hypothetical protein
MIEFSCSRTSEDNTPVIRDIEIAKFAQCVLYDYRPELLTYTSYGEDPYYEPALLDPYDFANNYLGSNIEVHDIYTESDKDVIAGAAVFNLQKVKVFDKEHMCTREILVPPNTILLDTATVDHWHKGFEFFTIMHEVGHLMLHQRVYRIEPMQGFYTTGNVPDVSGDAVLCMRSNIGRSSGGLKTNEDFREHQANTFAASMLMPPRLFIPYVQKQMKQFNRFDDELMVTHTINDGSREYWRYRDVVRLTAKQFGVSTRAAEVQMTKYGLQADLKDASVKEARRRLKMYQSLYR